MDVIFPDYHKAFDSVPQEGFLSKLQAYAIVGVKILNWIEGFVCGRSQYVTVRKGRSEEAEVTSGVLQGLVLGHSNTVELLMLVNQPQKWTQNGVISVGVFTTLNGMTYAFQT